MTTEELVRELGLQVLTDSGMEKEICGCYIGDLLSRVISRAKPHGVWITIMTNLNVAAVAHLADVSCVILAEGVLPDPQLSERFRMIGIPLCRSEDDAYSLAVTLKDLFQGIHLIKEGRKHEALLRFSYSFLPFFVRRG